MLFCKGLWAVFGSEIDYCGLNESEQYLLSFSCYENEPLHPSAVSLEPQAPHDPTVSWLYRFSLTIWLISLRALTNSSAQFEFEVVDKDLCLISNSFNSLSFSYSSYLKTTSLSFSYLFSSYFKTSYSLNRLMSLSLYRSSFSFCNKNDSF